MDTQVTFNIPSELDATLRDLAAKRMVSKSALIRMILADHVAAAQAVAPTPTPATEEVASV